MASHVTSELAARMGKEVKALATSPPEGIKYVETDADQLTEIYAEMSGPSPRRPRPRFVRAGAARANAGRRARSRDAVRGRRVPPQARPRQRLPLGAAARLLPHQDLPPEHRVRAARVARETPERARARRGADPTAARRSNGDICVNTLKRDWKPEVTLSHVLQVIRCLLIVPFPESSLNDEAGKLFMTSYDEYAARARLFTDLHALKRKAPSPAKSATGSLTENNAGDADRSAVDVEKQKDAEKQEKMQKENKKKKKKALQRL